jgi:hypothetical protein
MPQFDNEPVGATLHALVMETAVVGITTDGVEQTVSLLARRKAYVE